MSAPIVSVPASKSKVSPQEQDRIESLFSSVRGKGKRMVPKNEPNSTYRLDTGGRLYEEEIVSGGKKYVRRVVYQEPPGSRREGAIDHIEYEVT